MCSPMSSFEEVYDKFTKNIPWDHTGFINKLVPLNELLQYNITQKTKINYIYDASSKPEK